MVILMKYKIYIFLPLFLLTCFFVFSGSVSARAEKTCYYGDYHSGEFGYSSAKAEVFKANNGDFYVNEVTFYDLSYPDVAGGVTSNTTVGYLAGVGGFILNGPIGGIIGGVVGSNIDGNARKEVGELNPLDKSDVKEKDELTVVVANSNAQPQNKMRNQFYYVMPGETTSSGIHINGYVSKMGWNGVHSIEEFFKQYSGGEVTCPSHVVLVRNDVDANIEVSMGKNWRAYLIDEGMSVDENHWGLNEMRAKIQEYSGHNMMFFSGIHTTSAKNPDEATEKEEEKDYDTCEGLLGTIDKSTGEYEENTTGWLLQKIFDYAKLAVAAIIFGMTVKDYAMALTAQDDGKFKIANTNLIKRIAFALVFFLLPELVNIIVGVVDSSTCGIK